MKTNRILLLLFLLAIGACAQKPPVTTGAVPQGVEDQLFVAGEAQFAAGDYPAALASYQAYVNQYPDRPLTPAAWMKIGDIHLTLGNTAEARQTYRHLISEYPQSSFSKDAQVNVLLTFYEQGDYRAVVDQAPEVLWSVDSTPHVFRTYALVGDAYMALGSPMEAFQYYGEASLVASEIEQEAIGRKIETAIAQLDSEQITRLLESGDPKIPRGDLMFQLGLNYAMVDQYDDALKALEDFLIEFPAHKNASAAEDLIEQIKQSALFNRYTLGCLLPLSGPYQKIGLQALKGIELALDQFSAQNVGPQMNIIVKDSGGNPDQTRAAMQELIEEQVAAIVGPIITAEIAAIESQANKIPIMTLTQKDSITSIGDYVFRNFITPRMQVNNLVDYVTASLGLHRFAILYPDEPYGITFMNLFWDELIAHGGKIVGVESYNPQHTDFAEPIKKLVGLYYDIPEDLKEKPEPDNAVDAEDPQSKRGGDEEEPQAIVDFEAVFIPDYPKTVGLIIPQLAFYDIRDVYLLGTNLWHSDVLIKMAPQYVQGAIMPDGFFAGSSAPVVQNFVSVFEQTYEEKPGFIEAVVYDSAMMFFGVLAQPDVRFKSDIKNYLLNMQEFMGVTGPTKFDENGEAQKELHLLRIKGRDFVELLR
ncbi:MAG: penicillin-binding protein activator [Deltaproteobacteria bacterium]|jgi:ABC-type branched-subunit amino acid transport system substrate-binding protein/Tfp pilus assembly protein PilF|nr:penicillin-binding protein activator [Deltaproteobacteria bacterium]